jgi:hypothetical protein
MGDRLFGMPAERKLLRSRLLKGNITESNREF